MERCDTRQKLVPAATGGYGSRLIRVALPHENQMVYQGIEMYWISPRLASETVDIRQLEPLCAVRALNQCAIPCSDRIELTHRTLCSQLIRRPFSWCNSRIHAGSGPRRSPSLISPISIYIDPDRARQPLHSSNLLIPGLHNRRSRLVVQWSNRRQDSGVSGSAIVGLR
jgi:hypothetical protein